MQGRGDSHPRALTSDHLFGGCFRPCHINYDATDTSRGLYTRLADCNYFAGLRHSADLLKKPALMSKVRACECTAPRWNRVLTSHCSLSEEDPRRPHFAPNCRKYQNRTRQVQRGMERAKFIYATDKYQKTSTSLVISRTVVTPTTTTMRGMSLNSRLVKKHLPAALSLAAGSLCRRRLALAARYATA